MGIPYRLRRIRVPINTKAIVDAVCREGTTIGGEAVACGIGRVGINAQLAEIIVISFLDRLGLHSHCNQH